MTGQDGGPGERCWSEAERDELQRRERIRDLGEEVKPRLSCKKFDTDLF